MRQTKKKGCSLLEKHLHVYWHSPHNYHLWQVLRAYEAVAVLLVLNFITMALKHKQKEFLKYLEIVMILLGIDFTAMDTVKHKDNKFKLQ